MLAEKSDLLRNAQVQNDDLKDQITRLYHFHLTFQPHISFRQDEYDRQRDYYEPEIDDKTHENQELANVIEDLEIQLHDMQRPVIIGQHDIERKLRIKIRDLEEELFHAHRERRK